MAVNKGKEFEQDFKQSLSLKPNLWVYRPSDFGGGQASRFTNPSLCDYMVFNKETGHLYLFELKSTQNTSISAPPLLAHKAIVEMQNHLHDIQVKEDKKVAQQAYKELLRKANTHNIKYHQICDLSHIENIDNTHGNIHPYFIINFRKYERTFMITPSVLISILKDNGKSSINIKDLEEHHALELKQERIRNTQHFTYEVL